MRVSGYRASNVWLRRQLDESWRIWMLRSTAFAAVLGLVLTTVVGPRQTSIRLRYQIAQVQGEVGRLAQNHRRLQLEREMLTSPTRLTDHLAELGLTPLTPDRVEFLTPDGRLVREAPAPVAPNAPKGGHD